MNNKNQKIHNENANESRNFAHMTSDDVTNEKIRMRCRDANTKHIRTMRNGFIIFLKA